MDGEAGRREGVGEFPLTMGAPLPPERAMAQRFPRQ